jgi:hypothetical protein
MKNKRKIQEEDLSPLSSLEMQSSNRKLKRIFAATFFIMHTKLALSR